MHLRVACFLRIFCRTGCVDDGSVYNRAAFHHVASGNHDAVNGVEKQLV